MSDFTPAVVTVSITAGGTAEVLVPAADADNPRQSLLINPQTEACLINFGATAGLQASGTLTFDTNPSNTETIDVNGVTFTFVTGASTSTNVHIGATKEETAQNFIDVLNASADVDVSVATYTLSGAVVTVTYDAGGVDGNAFTLADSSSGNVTRSAATLTGGSNTVGGIAIAQGQIAIFSAADFPQIRGVVYVVSPTDAAYINYLVGSGA